MYTLQERKAGYEKKVHFVIALALFQAAAVLPILLVPQFELGDKRLHNDDDQFELKTRGDISFLAEGGYKFGGKIILGFSNDALGINTDRLKQVMVLKT